MPASCCWHLLIFWFFSSEQIKKPWAAAWAWDISWAVEHSRIFSDGHHNPAYIYFINPAILIIWVKARPCARNLLCNLRCRKERGRKITLFTVMRLILAILHLRSLVEEIDFRPTFIYNRKWMYICWYKIAFPFGQPILKAHFMKSIFNLLSHSQILVEVEISL